MPRKSIRKKRVSKRRYNRNSIRKSRRNRRLKTKQKKRLRGGAAPTNIEAVAKNMEEVLEDLKTKKFNILVFKKLVDIKNALEREEKTEINLVEIENYGIKNEFIKYKPYTGKDFSGGEISFSGFSGYDDEWNPADVFSTKDEFNSFLNIYETDEVKEKLLDIYQQWNTGKTPPKNQLDMALKIIIYSIIKSFETKNRMCVVFDFDRCLMKEHSLTDFRSLQKKKQNENPKYSVDKCVEEYVTEKLNNISLNEFGLESKILNLFKFLKDKNIKIAIASFGYKAIIRKYIEFIKEKLEKETIEFEFRINDKLKSITEEDYNNFDIFISTPIDVSGENVIGIEGSRVLEGKVPQLDLIKKKLGLEKNNMIFFDDTPDNITGAIGKGYANSFTTMPFDDNEPQEEPGPEDEKKKVRGLKVLKTFILLQEINKSLNAENFTRKELIKRIKPKSPLINKSYKINFLSGLSELSKFYEKDASSENNIENPLLKLHRKTLRETLLMPDKTIEIFTINKYIKKKIDTKTISLCYDDDDDKFNIENPQESTKEPPNEFYQMKDLIENFNKETEQEGI